MKNRFEKLTIFATVLGGLPLLLLVCLPIYLWFQTQIIAQIYLMIILSFIAGIDWKAALDENNILILCWSIVLSLLPWFVMIYCLLTAEIVLSWVIFWIIINIAWGVDLHFVHKDKLLISIRNTGSIMLNILLLAIIIRLLFF